MAGPLVGGKDPSQSATAQARANALVGRTISDRYRIVEMVAMGAMGAVYKGEHLLMRKQVAIKVLHPEIEDFPELVARFEREAIAGAHVNHPNVASASDFGKFDGDSYFLILEYIEGTTLSDLIKQGPFEPLRAAKLARQLAAALGAAHLRGIVHRDVKPKNVMICEPSILETTARGGDEEIVKLIDFGLAKVPVEKLSDVARDPAADSRELTNAGVVMGTVAYMAPETALGMSAVGPRSDFYALGIILYEMLSGTHPFDAVEPQKLFAAHCTLPPPPFKVRNPNVNVPEDLEAIVMRLLEKDPDHRFPDAESLIAAIDAFKMRVALSGTVSFKKSTMPPPNVEEKGAAASSASGGLYIPKRPQQGRSFQGPALYVTVGVVALAAVGGGFFALGRGTASDGSPSTSQPEKTKPEPTPIATVTPTAMAPTAIATTATTVTAAPAPTPTEAPSASASAASSSASTPETEAARLLELLKAKPDLSDAAIRADLAQAAATVANAERKEADEIFQHLATMVGERGLDLLYAILLADETSKAGAKAKQWLDRPVVFSRASPALKAAYELRRGTCQTKPFQFQNAGRVGDERALVLLKPMIDGACQPSDTRCCYPGNADLAKAIADIEARSAK
ncbi:MAG: serine/threonine protein kinase [Polyangiaceae bacterium]|nr:serine/threonine protein kinase [Polyangiaceae bacterium]